MINGLATINMQHCAEHITKYIYYVIPYQKILGQYCLILGHTYSV